MTDAEIGLERAAGSRRIAMVPLVLAGVLVAFAGTAVGAGLPAMVARLNLTFSQAQWVNGLYALVSAALIIPAQRLGHRIGWRLALALGLALVVAGSLLSAAAHTQVTLVWGRILQAVASAVLVPAVLSLAVPPPKPPPEFDISSESGAGRGWWAWSLVVVAAAGSLLGGWLATTFSWPWVFLVDVVLGLVALVLVAAAAARPASEGEYPPLLDVDGLLCAIAGLAVLVFGVMEGPTRGWWRPRRDFPFLGITWSTHAAAAATPLLVLLGVSLLVIFAVRELRRWRQGSSTVVDPELLRDKGFGYGGAVVALMSFGAFGLLFALPLYMVNVLGMTPLRSGAVLATAALGALASAVWLAGPISWFGDVVTVRLTLATQTVVFVLVALCLRPHTAGWVLALLLFCYGLGLGPAAASLSRIAVRRAQPEVVTRAWSTQVAVALAGAALGTAAVGGVMSAVLSQQSTRRLNEVLPDDLAARLATATRDSAGITIPALRSHDGAGAVVEALSRAFTDATRASVMVSAVALALGFLAATRMSEVVGAHLAGAQSTRR